MVPAIFIKTRLAIVALTSVALASACGSTALKHGAAAPTDPVLGGGAVSVPTQPADTTGLVQEPAVPTGPAATVAPGPVGVLPTGRSSVPSGTVRVPSTPPLPPVPHVPVPSVAPKAPIRLRAVGVDTTAIASPFGKKATDTFAGIKPMISYLNAHGGVAGHLLKPVFVRVDSGADIEQSGQVACTSLTQDNTVDLVLTMGFASETLNRCLLAQGVSLFSDASWAPNAGWEQQFPNLYLPDALSADRYSAADLTSAVQRGQMKAGDKLGVLVENCPWANQVYDSVIVPTAQKLGVSVEKATVTCITNLVSDLGPVTQDITRDTLVLASKKATHVFALSAAEAFLSSTFSRVASTQKFFPRYIVSSTANPYVTFDMKNVVHFSPDALANIIGVGYRPLLDVGPKAAPTAAQAQQQAACRKMDPAEGGAARDTTDGKYFKLDSFYGLCDTFNAISFVLAHNGNRFGLADMARGFRQLLDGAVSAAAAGGRYGGGAFRHDGLGLVQPMTYSAATGKLAYVGQPVALG